MLSGGTLKAAFVIALMLLLEISSFAVGNCDGAGNCYVSIFASGTGTGADWANACTDFTGACDVSSVSMRGTTIWVGGSPGNWLGPAYTVQNFSAPASGTLPITIMGATAENHGTDTGWRKQSATALVPFGQINISTDYWVFDGGFRDPGGGTYHDQYFGYHMIVTNTNGAANGAIQISGSHVTLRYMSIFGSSGNYSGLMPVTQYGTTATDNGIYYAPGVTDEYIGYSWITNTGADLINASSGSNFIFEQNLLGRNHVGVATLKSNAFTVGDITNLIIRYNHIYNITNTAILTDANADAVPFTPNWYFYGNDITWVTGSNITAPPATANYGMTSGIVNLTGETLNGGEIKIYNNTIAGVNVAACVSTYSCNMTALNLNGAAGGSCAAHTQNCIGASAPVGTVYNNLWWDSYQAANIAVNVAANPQWTPTGDYGEGICAATGCSNGGSFTAAGPNDIAVNTGNPFTSFDARMGTVIWYNFDLRLKADTAPGLSVSGLSTTPSGCSTTENCMTVDPNYIARGDNGTVNRGAFQRPARALLTVRTRNMGFGVHVGQTFAQTPVCTWSSAPTTDDCPDGAAPFIKRWASLDKTTATVDSSGVVTGVSPHNTFIRLYYGGLSNLNFTTVVVTDGSGIEPIAALPTGIVRTGSPLAFSGYDTTAFDAAFPTIYSDPCPVSGVGGCTRWTPVTTAELNTNLTSAQPGDTIVLQSGTSYSTASFFNLPAKANPQNKWIYIISSNITQLPAQGHRISPNDAPNMPKLMQTGSGSLVVAAAGANHWWFAGIEFIGATTGPPSTIPPMSGAMLTTEAPNPATATAIMPDSFTVDRCYLHAAEGTDMKTTLYMNAGHFAVLDSYIGPGLAYQTQANAGSVYFSPGPYKIINNFWSGFGQAYIMGGSGGFSNMWVTHDVYVAHNIFWNDPAWRKVGFTIPPGMQYNIANNFELKWCVRCLIDGNVMQNSWWSAQGGTSIVNNTGTGVNGPDAAINDITYSNNIIEGSLQGIGPTEYAANGNGCGFELSPCQYPGEARRQNYFNNLYIMGDQGPPGGRLANGSFSIAGSITRLLSDFVWQHNTFVGPYLTDYPYCDRSFYFSLITNDTPPTQNMWILDNVLCRQTSGYSSSFGTAFLNEFMSDPVSVPVGTRYYGNVMQVFPGQGDVVRTWPANNIATTDNFTYVDPSVGNYQLASPTQIGSDGQQSGINYSVLMAHQRPPSGSLSISGTISGAVLSGVSITLTGGDTVTTWTDVNGHYSFTGLRPGSYTVSALRTGYILSPSSIPVTLTTANSTTDNFTTEVLVTHKITGTVTGVTGNTSVTLNAGVGMTAWTSVATDGTYGQYTLTVPANATYTIRPSLGTYVFQPATRTVTVGDADVTGQDFTGVLSYTVSGTVSGALINTIAMNLTGAATATVYTSTSGVYNFYGLLNGAYRVTPAPVAGYIFTPAFRDVTVNSNNVTGQSFSSAVQTYSLSGTVTGAVVAGVTLSLAGGASTTSDASGNYTIGNRLNGTFVVTATRVGYTFEPATRTAVVNNNDVTGLDFHATSLSGPTYSVSGTITSDGSGLAGAIVTAGSGLTGVTNASGNYTVNGVPVGSFTLTPALAGYAFSPTTLPITVSAANITGQNFTATAGATYAISGRISGASSVSVNLTGAGTGQTYTDGGGNYSFTNRPAGNYTVTPVLDGYTFSPVNRSPVVSNANVTGQDFTATASTYSISGTINGDVMSGVNVSLSGTSTASTTSDSSSAWSFSGLTNGNYTVTPTAAGYIFSPLSIPIAISGANSSGNIFTSTTGGVTPPGTTQLNVGHLGPPSGTRTQPPKKQPKQRQQPQP